MAGGTEMMADGTVIFVPRWSLRAAQLLHKAGTHYNILALIDFIG